MSTQAAITAKITRKPKATATGFRNAIGKYKVIRTDRCTGCGKCAQLCPHGVHVRYVAYSRTARPKDHLCRGTWCKENCDYYCIDKCPAGALSLGLNPVHESMGDPSLAYACAGALQDLVKQHESLQNQNTKNRQRPQHPPLYPGPAATIRVPGRQPLSLALKQIEQDLRGAGAIHDLRSPTASNSFPPSWRATEESHIYGSVNERLHPLFLL